MSSVTSKLLKSKVIWWLDILVFQTVDNLKMRNTGETGDINVSHEHGVGSYQS